MTSNYLLKRKMKLILSYMACFTKLQIQFSLLQIGINNILIL